MSFEQRTSDNERKTMNFELLQETDRLRVFAVDLVAEDSAFQGHFPDLPILPGVVQVDRAMHLQAWYQQHQFLRVDRLKFKQIITPGDELVLTLKHKGKGKVSFEYHCGDRNMSSGDIVFESGL